MRLLRGFLVFALIAVIATASRILLVPASDAQQSSPSATAGRDVSGLARSSLRFESNLGQTDPNVRFLARGDGYMAFLTPQELVLRLASARAGEQGTSVRVRFVGAASCARLAGRLPLASTSHYFVGKDSDRWKTDIPNFSRVECDELYPGVDLGYTAHGRQLELDWAVAPGTDPSRIRLEFQGVDTVEVNEAGALLLKQADVEFQFRKPTLFQQDGPNRREVAGRYRTNGAQVSFEIGEYDKGQPLVIDPVLTYSSYLGGQNLDFAQALAVDPFGGVYVAGQSLSTEFPTNDFLRSDSMFAYVAKLNPSGTTVEHVTFIGGTDLPLPLELLFDMMSLAVDAAGHVYLVGDTSASDFPTVNAMQPQNNGGHDAFVVKIAPGGSSLVYSTYLGGTGEDWGRRLALDAAGNVVIAGITTSPDFPTVSALQPQLAGFSDAFVAKLDPTGSTLLYSTFLGGSDGEQPGTAGDLGYGVAVDSAGNAYLCGYTTSPDFPTVHARQPQYSGGSHDAFVAKIAADGSALIYSTYLGGVADEECLAITVDGSGSAFVTGWTTSPDFPVQGAAQGRRGELDAFVTKLAADGESLLYSTYLGGTSSEFGYGIVVNGAGEAYVIGATDSPDFPVVAAVQPSFAGGANDAFISVLNAGGDALVSSTFLGGSGAENHLVTSMGIALTYSGDAIVAGSTSSPDFPMVQPARYEFGGSVDVFVAKISYGPQVRLTPDPGGDKRVLHVDLSNAGNAPREVQLGVWVIFSGQLVFPVYPSGGIETTLAPADERRSTLVFPAFLLPAVVEVRASLFDTATGAVVSASACVAYTTPSWICSR